MDFAEVVHGLLELAGESLVLHAESGESAVSVNDIEIDSSLLGGRIGGAVEEGGGWLLVVGCWLRIGVGIGCVIWKPPTRF